MWLSCFSLKVLQKQQGLRCVVLYSFGRKTRRIRGFEFATFVQHFCAVKIMKSDKAMDQHMMTNHNVSTASLVAHVSGKQYVAIFWMKNCKRKLNGSKYVATCNTKTIVLPPCHTHKNVECFGGCGVLLNENCECEPQCRLICNMAMGPSH